MTTREQFLKGGAAAVAGVSLLGMAEGRRKRRRGDPTKPNVVVVVADDLDRYVYTRMKGMAGRMGAEGTTFPNFLVSTSVCVPSRATILRGQYAHNHGIGENGNGAALFRDRGLDRETLATRVREAGYATWFGGKYINGASSAYPDSYKPPGWDSFSYYTSKNRANVNGRVVDFSPQNYTDWLSDRADRFVVNRPPDRPFFMQVWTKDPHEPTEYPDRNAGKFSKVTVPQPPSFDEADLSDKPAWLRDDDPWTNADTRGATLEFRERLRAMATTEDLVLRLLSRLEAEGVLWNTYVFFTSDNGFHLGLHGLHTRKWTPYTEAHRVPFVVRGPGVAVSAVPNALASNIDIAPTVLDLAGAEVPRWMDGRSLKPILRGEQEKVRDALLLEGSPHESVPAYEAVKTVTDTYVEWHTGEKEYYLAMDDPYQLESKHGDPAYSGIMAERAAQVQALSGCSGDSCRTADARP